MDNNNQNTNGHGGPPKSFPHFLSFGGSQPNNRQAPGQGEAPPAFSQAQGQGASTLFPQWNPRQAAPSTFFQPTMAQAAPASNTGPTLRQGASLFSTRLTQGQGAPVVNNQQGFGQGAPAVNHQQGFGQGAPAVNHQQGFGQGAPAVNHQQGFGQAAPMTNAQSLPDRPQPSRTINPQNLAYQAQGGLTGNAYATPSAPVGQVANDQQLRGQVGPAPIQHNQGQAGLTASRFAGQPVQVAPTQVAGNVTTYAIPPGWTSEPVGDEWDSLCFHCGQDITQVQDHPQSWFECQYGPCILCGQNNHAPGTCPLGRPHVNRASKYRKKAGAALGGRGRGRGGYGSRTSYGHRQDHADLLEAIQTALQAHPTSGGGRGRGQGRARGAFARSNIRGSGVLRSLGTFGNVQPRTIQGQISLLRNNQHQAQQALGQNTQAQAQPASTQGPSSQEELDFEQGLVGAQWDDRQRRWFVVDNGPDHTGATEFAGTWYRAASFAQHNELEARKQASTAPTVTPTGLNGFNNAGQGGIAPPSGSGPPTAGLNGSNNAGQGGIAPPPPPGPGSSTARLNGSNNAGQGGTAPEVEDATMADQEAGTENQPEKMTREALAAQASISRGVWQEAENANGDTVWAQGASLALPPGYTPWRTNEGDREFFHHDTSGHIFEKADGCHEDYLKLTGESAPSSLKSQDLLASPGGSATDQP